ncbi:MAG: hypothetical protein ABIQ12_11215 [Opitutaceae bacterium]
MTGFNQRLTLTPWKKDLLISLLVGGIMVGALVLLFTLSGPTFGHSGPTILSALIVMFDFIPALENANEKRVRS